MGKKGAMGRTILVWLGTEGERGDWATVEHYVREQGKPKEELRQLMLW